MSQTSRESGADPEKNDWLKQFSGLPGEPVPDSSPPPRTAPSEAVEPADEVVDEAEPSPAAITSSHRLLYFQMLVLPLLLIAAIVTYEVLK